MLNLLLKSAIDLSRVMPVPFQFTVDSLLLQYFLSSELISWGYWNSGEIIAHDVLCFVTLKSLVCFILHQNIISQVKWAHFIYVRIFHCESKTWINPLSDQIILLLRPAQKISEYLLWKISTENFIVGNIHWDSTFVVKNIHLRFGIRRLTSPAVTHLLFLCFNFFILFYNLYY